MVKGQQEFKANYVTKGHCGESLFYSTPQDCIATIMHFGHKLGWLSFKVTIDKVVHQYMLFDGKYRKVERMENEPR